LYQHARTGIFIGTDVDDREKAYTQTFGLRQGEENLDERENIQADRQ
jgi:hypothetical protein